MTTIEATWLATTALLGGILLAITLIDIRSFRIPNPLSFALIFLGLTWSAYFHGLADVWKFALAAVAGYSALYLCNQAYRGLRGEDGIGMGDAKLLAGGGALLGLSNLPIVTFVAAASALAYLLFTRLKGVRFSLDAALPFGPFLALGIWVVWLWNSPMEIWLRVSYYV